MSVPLSGVFSRKLVVHVRCRSMRRPTRCEFPESAHGGVGLRPSSVGTADEVPAPMERKTQYENVMLNTLYVHTSSRSASAPNRGRPCSFRSCFHKPCSRQSLPSLPWLLLPSTETRPTPPALWSAPTYTFAVNLKFDSPFLINIPECRQQHCRRDITYHRFQPSLSNYNYFCARQWFRRP